MSIAWQNRVDALEKEVKDLKARFADIEATVLADKIVQQEKNNKKRSNDQRPR